MPTRPRTATTTPATPAKAPVVQRTTQTKSAPGKPRASAKTAKTKLTFEVNGNQRIRLTNREVIDVESKTGMTFAYMTGRGELNIPWAFYVGLAWIVLRRENAEVAFDDLLDDNIDGDVIKAVAGLVDVPTVPAKAT